jgi:predicted Holliday junction resolvase-like endonuclease
MALSDTLSKMTPIKWIIATALALILILFIWLYVTKGINGISNFFFWRKANAEQKVINEKLAKAEKQQKVVDQTLLRLAESEKKLAEASKAREESERIFNDSTKTSREKVEAFKEALSAAPIHTDPNSVSDDDLCTRAKAAGSNPAALAALCGQ